MEERKKATAEAQSSHDENIRREILRVNSRLNHYRGVAASVMKDALNVWLELRDACQDPRTCLEIIDGVEAPSRPLPRCGWQEFREKLHLLGHYLEYSKRLCEGSVDDTSPEESEVEP